MEIEPLWKTMQGWVSEIERISPNVRNITIVEPKYYTYTILWSFLIESTISLLPIRL